jgi:hypothetical protein
MIFFGEVGVRNGESAIGQGSIGPHSNGEFSRNKDPKARSLCFQGRKKASQAAADHKDVGVEFFHRETRIAGCEVRVGFKPVS